MSKYKKGFTLVELCIALALIAMIATMVVSFTVFAAEKVSKIPDLGVVSNDITKFREVVDKFILHYDNAKYYIKQIKDKDDNRTTIGLCVVEKKSVNEKYDDTTEDETIIARINFDTGTHTLTADYPDSEDRDIECQLDTITYISYSFVTVESSQNKLITATLSYMTDIGETENVSLTFITHAQGGTVVRAIEKG